MKSNGEQGEKIEKRRPFQKQIDKKKLKFVS